jgi:BirA family transcriptional regulator, biotin operon repressor / biotin---[acetyl-CoA-carboxylase] ligase
LEIVFLKSVDSTHTYLKNHIKQNGYLQPLCIVTQYQTNGIGSRDNQWEGKEGNLFFSFVYKKEELPLDIPMQSYSIYFSFLLKSVLEKMGSKLWLKWPNDFYIEDKKFGGTITNLSGEMIYCGIGINLQKVEDAYGCLDIKIDLEELLCKYFSTLEEKISWKHIFSKYLIEFAKSRDFKTTINNKKVSLKNAILNTDGSISINEEKVFSLR